MSVVTVRARLVLAILGALYLGGLGFLSGMVLERMRFDIRRTEVLTRLATTQARLHARLMELERRTDGGRTTNYR